MNAAGARIAAQRGPLLTAYARLPHLLAPGAGRGIGRTQRAYTLEPSSSKASSQATTEMLRRETALAAEREQQQRRQQQQQLEQQRQAELTRPRQLDWESPHETPPSPPSRTRRAARPPPSPAAASSAHDSIRPSDTATTTTTSSGADVPPPVYVTAAPVVAESLMDKTRRIVHDLPRIIKEGAQHYWLGTKLLYVEIRTTISIVNRLTQGHTMTRRERRQLIRTTSDLLRVIPFSIFVIVPFMEFLLPVALKLFPNMLPSTFEDKLKAEENMKKRLKLRIELAKFLQDTAEQLALRKDEHSSSNLLQMMSRIRAGQAISNDEILKFATAFQDEYTLDNVSRVQLVAMCKYMALPPYGSDGLLKFQLERKLRQLKLDDQMIRDEGVNTLSLEELQQALRARGMRGTSMSKMVLRKRLNEWLTLSLDHRIPESLLILTRAFLINEKDDLGGAIKTTLSSLPEEVLEEVSVNMDTTTAPRDLKLEVLEHQNEHISQELLELRNKKQQGALLSDGELAKEMALTERLKTIGQAISLLTNGAVAEERTELAELKKERSEHKKAERSAAADVTSSAKAAAGEAGDGRATTAASGKKQAAAAGDGGGSGSRSLEARLDSLVAELEHELELVDRAVGSKIKHLGLLLDQDRDGLISTEELAGAVQALKAKLSVDEIASMDRDKDGKISLHELLAYYSDNHQKKVSDTVAKP
eukprot:TRINITY_DN829_c0_g1_i2.p1 TRINITY_DN829_c0_g1~~TRINITY_DN829_c0_g1_i2.p1  ORF type:complete len:704 (+),score=339.20 TRINITY_DN829_c0_g1_i2:189-2300(+)